MERREVLKVLLAGAGLSLTGGVARAARATAPTLPDASPLAASPRGIGGSPGSVAGRVPAPLAMIRTSWSTDPWTLGSYSFLPVGAHPKLRGDLRTPVGDRLFFAGEHTAKANPSTVHGALASGRRAARQVRRTASRGERVIVVGAGIAGLACATDLRAAGLGVVVLEARGRVGGRLDTVQPAGWPVPVERGASWVEDVNASDLESRLDELGVETAPFDWDRESLVGPAGNLLRDPWAFSAPAARATREAVRWANTRDRDLSLEAALTRSGAADSVDPRALQHYVETEIAAEYGASARELSAWWGQDEGTDGRDLLVLGGYARLAQGLAAHLDVRLARPVDQVAWSSTGVVLTDHLGGVEAGDRAVISVPLGVLKSGAVGFAPALPQAHRAAIARLGMGLLDKVWLRFSEPFWTRRTLIWTRVAPAGTPWVEWYDLMPLTGEPVLVSLMGGDTARAWATRTDQEVLEAALASLEVFIAAGI
jgi:monoamine oxidase